MESRFSARLRWRTSAATPAEIPAHHQPKLPANATNPARALAPESDADSDIIIAVMGPTGAGKSTLINNILGRQQTLVGHSLESCTQKVQSFTCYDSQGRRIILVDSPGFNDTNVSDLDVLQSIADWLKQSYEENKLLSGLLFLHRISDNRIAGSPLRLLDIFKNICGADAFRNVVLVTTMWDEVTLDVGECREKELLENDRYWKPMLVAGSRMARSMNTAESAWAIVSKFKPEYRRPVLLQTELVDHQRNLAETAAGRSFFGWLEEVIASLKKVLQDLRKRLHKARQDPVLQANIAQRQVVLDKANRIIGRYTYPLPPRHPGLHRQNTDAPNITLDLAERSTTPESEDTADTSTIASGQDDCPAPPSSPSDRLTFDRMNRRALHGSVTALKVIHQLVGSSPIRGLKTVVATILKIAELIEKIDCIDDSLVSLYQNTCSMTSGIIEVIELGVSGPIEAVVDSFVIELTQVKMILTYLEKGLPHMYKRSLGNQDKMAVDECNRRLLSAYRRIVLPAGVLSHSKAGMEDRLNSAITMLHSKQSLPNLGRNPTYP